MVTPQDYAVGFGGGPLAPHSRPLDRPFALAVIVPVPEPFATGSFDVPAASTVTAASATGTEFTSITVDVLDGDLVTALQQGRRLPAALLGLADRPEAAEVPPVVQGTVAALVRTLQAEIDGKTGLTSQTLQRMADSVGSLLEERTTTPGRARAIRDAFVAGVTDRAAHELAATQAMAASIGSDAFRLAIAELA